MANRAISPEAAAASSSSTASVSASTSYSTPASTSYCPWDVFINHRGPDVKNSFASHLYRRLISNGLRTFLDREELEEGQKFSSQIEQAIRDASLHIAIFSPKYAESSWCLDELALMLNSGSTILPVFYKVHPSVVRHTNKSGAYAEALRVLEQKTTLDRKTGEEKPRYSSDTIQKWKDALSDVADRSGFELHGDDDEGELLDNLMKSVLKKVQKPPLDVAKHPTGLDLKVQEFEETVLSKQEMERVAAQVVGIWGVGGVGKTTLAKAMFNLRRSGYNKSSFLIDVRENTRRKGINYLQSQLIEDLVGEKIEIRSGDEGIWMLRHYLSSCHALVVLDDIDHLSQLEAALLPIRDVLSPDSLILVTSRDKHVLLSSGVLLEHSIYNLKGLSRPHSKELFCSYAFNQPFAIPEFADLAEQFVRACDGLPLSLRVFGALVCGQNEPYWEAKLNEVDKVLPNEIQEKLKISYDSLSANDQQVFLDITHFFIGEKISTAIRIWGPVGIQNLLDKCLLEVGRDADTENKWIRMHDHIRDMGRDIAKGDLPRRVWDATTADIKDLLEQPSRVMTEVRGITSLDYFPGHGMVWRSSQMLMSRYRRWRNGPRLLFNDSRLCGTSNLQFLSIRHDYLERILHKARSPQLRWLRWRNCPYSCLPYWVPMENLRVLEVEGQWLKTLWQGKSRAPLQLRELLITASSFSSFPKSIGQLKDLEKITILPGSCRFSYRYLHPCQCSFQCSCRCFPRYSSRYSSQYLHSERGFAIKRLPEEFCELHSLKYLHLDCCIKLISLPECFGKLTNLQHIDLSGASSLQMLPESFGSLTRLKYLNLGRCHNLNISSATLGSITTMEYFSISGCSNVRELPPQVAQQRSLKELRLAGANLRELPSWIGNLCNLEALSIGNDSLEELPPMLSYLKGLKELGLHGARRLKYLPDHFLPLTQMESLTIRDSGIQYLPHELLKMNSLRSLTVDCCPLVELPFKRIEAERELNKLESIHDNDKYLFGLKVLRLQNTDLLEVFFPECVCPNLERLSLYGCKKLTQIGGLSGLSKLQHLDIVGSGLEELPNIEMLICLGFLNVSGCVKLKSIPGLGQLKKLRTLRAIQCPEMVELTGAKHLMSLRYLAAMDCPKLRWGEGEVEQLRQRLGKGLLVG